jgi:hypothetical protein
MWMFIRIPPLPLEACDGFPVVSFQKYSVAEKDIVTRGQAIALARNKCATFEIRSNYRGRLLKLILEPGMLVSFGDPIATMEVLDSPDARPGQISQIIQISERGPAESAKFQLLRVMRNLVVEDNCNEWESWVIQNSQAIEGLFGSYFRRKLETNGLLRARDMLGELGVEME